MMAGESALSFSQTGDAELEVRLAGAWRLRGGLPSASLLQRELDGAPRIKSIAFDTKELKSCESGVLDILVHVSALSRLRGIQMDRGRLPTGLHRLLDLAEVVPDKQAAR